jgi:hypothetical protein
VKSPWFGPDLSPAARAVVPEIVAWLYAQADHARTKTGGDGWRSAGSLLTAHVSEATAGHVSVTMPGLVMRELEYADMPTELRDAIDSAVVSVRGHGKAYVVTAPIEVHEELLRRTEYLCGDGGVATTGSQKAAWRKYWERVEETR